jgi:hypothetical protein
MFISNYFGHNILVHDKTPLLQTQVLQSTLVTSPSLHLVPPAVTCSWFFVERDKKLEVSHDFLTHRCRIKWKKLWKKCSKVSFSLLLVFSLGTLELDSTEFAIAIEKKLKFFCYLNTFVIFKPNKIIKRHTKLKICVTIQNFAVIANR